MTPWGELKHYAAELRVSVKTVRIMGGVEKLKKLTPEARNLLLFRKTVVHKRGISRSKVLAV